MEGISLFYDAKPLTDNVFEKDGYFFACALKGSLKFSFFNSDFSFSAGDALIIRNHAISFAVTDVSDDFSCLGVFVTNPCLAEMRIGRYATDSHRKASLFIHPVFPMSPERRETVYQSFHNLCKRMEDKNAYHYEDSVSLAFAHLVLDLSESQIEYYFAQERPDTGQEVFKRFIQLLEEGNYKEHRDVNWYADQLSITPKHLSHCVKAASGYNVKYWIDSISIHSLIEALRTHSVQQVCSDYHFSSLSYLSRYVKRLLGVSPREIQ